VSSGKAFSFLQATPLQSGRNLDSHRMCPRFSRCSVGAVEESARLEASPVSHHWEETRNLARLPGWAEGCSRLSLVVHFQMWDGMKCSLPLVERLLSLVNPRVRTAPVRTDLLPKVLRADAKCFAGREDGAVQGFGHPLGNCPVIWYATTPPGAAFGAREGGCQFAKGGTGGGDGNSSSQSGGRATG
jgi:hypothetical protein